MARLADLRCGAVTRKGTPCESKALSNGRCRNHGGLSTGPRTAAGLERMRIAVKARRAAESTAATP